MDDWTRNVLIHSIIMASISFVFMIYFKFVQNNIEFQQQIIDNSFVLPVALILVVEGYLGYVIVLTSRELRRIDEQKKTKKIKKIPKNYFTLGVHFFKEFLYK